MEQQEFEFSPRLVDELFGRRSDREITDTIAGLGGSLEGSVDRSRFSNTAIAIARLIGRSEYLPPSPSDPLAPYGRFRGRHIIGTGTHVLGGVYLGHTPREAIVIDEASSFFKSFAMQFMEDRFSVMKTQVISGQIELEFSPDGFRRAFVQDLPKALFHFTKACLTYDERKVATVFREARIQPDDDLPLDVYLAARVGVCRHMVLFLVGMFELLSKMRLTQGRMSVCRCYIPNLFSHAWARFEEDGVEPLILDPAQNYVGPLENGGEMGKFVYDHEFAKLLSAA